MLFSILHTDLQAKNKGKRHLFILNTHLKHVSHLALYNLIISPLYRLFFHEISGFFGDASEIQEKHESSPDLQKDHHHSICVPSIKTRLN